ncbi:MAG: hypothetical protein KAJ19_19610, partial [Gammaproteobacteria bacterium]|nr:hypothetical protein [Gammaproteobacteria bacterium]
MSKVTFDLEDYLVNTRGFVLVENYGVVILSDEKCHIRILPESNKIQFGFKSSFDRWANSVDYEEDIPRTRTRIDKTLEYVGKMIKCSRCEAWAAKGDL